MQNLRTVAIAELKAHLSAELKRVSNGETITIVDHKRPVARITGLGSGPVYVRRSTKKFVWQSLSPLFAGDLQALIDTERADSW